MGKLLDKIMKKEIILTSQSETFDVATRKDELIFELASTQDAARRAELREAIEELEKEE